MDAYRLESTAEYIALGAEDYIGAADTVSIVEWAEKIPLLAQYNPIVRITISTKQQTERNIVVER
jgi:tRNA A37 threonylcarbamoyladenosine biosynthesis protein TsaE